MKKQIIILCTLSFFLLFQCSSDDTNSGPKPIQEPEEIDIPVENFEVVGYKLTLTEIFCEESNDQGDADSRSEFYGYISASASFDNDYIYTTDKLETNEKAVLFYRYKDHWFGLKTNETKSLEKSFDFYFNSNHVGKASILLDGWLKEKDPDDKDDDDFGYRTKEINVEDIKLDLEYELPFDYNGDIAIARFKFEKFSINSDALTYPDGYGSEDTFNVSSGDYPPPNPTSYTSGIPVSKKYAIIQQNPSKLYPQPNKVNLLGITSLFVYNQNPKFVSDSKIIEPEFQIFCNEVHNDTNCVCLIEIDETTHQVTYGTSAVGTGSTITGPEISEIPIMQIIQYWVPIKVWRIPAGASKTYTVTYTHGWEKTQEFGISATLGYTSLSGFSAELAASYNYSISENYSKEEKWETSFSAPEDKNVVYVTWQRVNEIRLINPDGTIFKDENYYFSSMPVAHVPSNDIIDIAYPFNTL